MKKKPEKDTKKEKEEKKEKDKTKGDSSKEEEKKGKKEKKKESEAAELKKEKSVCDPTLLLRYDDKTSLSQQKQRVKPDFKCANVTEASVSVY